METDNETPAEPAMPWCDQCGAYHHENADHIKKEDALPEAKTPKKKAAAKKNGGAPKPGSKLEIIAKLLARKNGCTAKDVMEACDWPAVSMPQQARSLGIKLRTEKIGRETRYWAA